MNSRWLSIALLAMTSFSSTLTNAQWETRHLEVGRSQVPATPQSYIDHSEWGTSNNHAVDQSVHLGRIPDAIHHRVTLEGLFLSRSDLDGGTFVVDDNGPSLAYSDLDFELETDFRIGYGLFTSYDGGLEFTLFETRNTVVNVQDGPNVIPTFFMGIPAAPASSYDIFYETELQSYELNYWIRNRQSGRIGFGGRYFAMDEIFNITETASGGTTGFFSETENQLYGLQLIIDEKRVIGNGILINAGLKAGGYGNSMDLSAISEADTLTGSDDAFSFNLDFWAGLEFQLDGLTTIRAGYQGLYFSNVALAPAQSETLSIFTGNVSDLTLEDATYHGLYVGGNLSF